jgi:hypothetical protein
LSSSFIATSATAATIATTVFSLGNAQRQRRIPLAGGHDHRALRGCPSVGHAGRLDVSGGCPVLGRALFRLAGLFVGRGVVLKTALGKRILRCGLCALGVLQSYILGRLEPGLIRCGLRLLGCTREVPTTHVDASVLQRRQLDRVRLARGRPEQRALGLLELVAPHVVHERVTVVLPHARPVVACCHGRACAKLGWLRKLQVYVPFRRRRGIQRWRLVRKRVVRGRIPPQSRALRLPERQFLESSAVTVAILVAVARKVFGDAWTAITHAAARERIGGGGRWGCQKFTARA